MMDRQHSRVEAFRAPAVCRIAGITYKQLDYWARTGLLVPSLLTARGSGSYRLYSAADVRKAEVIGTLLRIGISLQMIREYGPDNAVEHIVDLLSELVVSEVSQAVDSAHAAARDGGDA